MSEESNIIYIQGMKGFESSTVEEVFFILETNEEEHVHFLNHVRNN